MQSWANQYDDDDDEQSEMGSSDADGHGRRHPRRRYRVLKNQLVYVGNLSLPATAEEAEGTFPHIPKRVRGARGDDRSAGASATGSAATRQFNAYAEANSNDVQKLRSFPAFSAEVHLFSAQVAEIVQLAERLAGEDAVSLRDERCAKAAMYMSRRLFLFTAQNRFVLGNEHRVCLWMARLRCVHLELLCDVDSADTRLAACSVSADRDAEQRAAHGVLLASHSAQNEKSLAEWALKHGLMRASFRGNLVDGVRSSSLVVLWKCLATLTHRWIELPYTAQLIAYTHLLLQRVATLSSYAVGYAQLTQANYKHTRALFNYPDFVEQRQVKGEDGGGGARTVLCVNDEFLRTTERLFFALEYSMLACATHVQWLTPALSASEQRMLDVRLHPALSATALQRFEQLVATMLARHSVEDARLAREQQRTLATSYVDYIERDFQDRFYNSVVLPGEWERFEMLRPYDDRRSITCVSRMRESDFNRYQKLYMDRPVEDVWAALVRDAHRSHPAYALIAERAVHYYFDEHFGSNSLAVYLVDANAVPPQMPADLGQGAENSPASDPPPPGAHFRRPEQPSSVARGTARHILLGARGAHCTVDSSYPHPLVVRTLGSFVVTDTHGAAVAPRRVSREQNFAAAFLHWLRAMCADRRIRGVLTNGLSVAALLEELRPHNNDSLQLAAQCTAKLEALRRERLESTKLISAADFDEAANTDTKDGEVVF